MAFYAIAPLGVVAVGSVLAVTRSFAAVETQVQKSYYGTHTSVGGGHDC